MSKKLRTIFVDPAASQPQSGEKGGTQNVLPKEPTGQAHPSIPSFTGIPQDIKRQKKSRSTASDNDPTFGITEENISPQDRQDVGKELKKDELLETKKQEEKLENLTENAQKLLFKCSSIFPFDLFPDELTIEPTQVNVCKKTFFLTNRLQSVPVKNISDVIVQTVPFFASIKVVDQFFVDNSFQLDFIKKEDAERARNIIQGLIIASKEGVDVARIDRKQLIERVEKMGQMRAMK
jgi:hypothetical protein